MDMAKNQKKTNKALDVEMTAMWCGKWDSLSEMLTTVEGSQALEVSTSPKEMNALVACGILPMNQWRRWQRNSGMGCPGYILNGLENLARHLGDGAFYSPREMECKPRFYIGAPGKVFLAAGCPAEAWKMEQDKMEVPKDEALEMVDVKDKVDTVDKGEEAPLVSLLCM